MQEWPCTGFAGMVPEFPKVGTFTDRQDKPENGIANGAVAMTLMLLALFSVCIFCMWFRRTLRHWLGSHRPVSSEEQENYRSTRDLHDAKADDDIVTFVDEPGDSISF